MQLVTKACRACQREFKGGELFCPDDGTRLSTRSRIDARGPADALVGLTLDGRYRVLRLIGEGGMGFVYEAEHVSLDKRVALKVLRDDFSRRPEVVARFHQEARSASRIGHPNIVDVVDFGETPGGASYFVMEMLDGEDLADRLGREVTLSPAMASYIARECCAALAAAHAKGIIHRDLKPENVFLVEREGDVDLVKIVDFGVAKMIDDGARTEGRKLTRTGMVFGTPEYMSPEQAAGQPPDRRVDVYSLGVILYEMVTGRVPFEGDNFMQVLNRHSSSPVPAMRATNPRCTPSAELESVVMRALEKKPDARFMSMADMAVALDATPELSSGVPAVSMRAPVGRHRSEESRADEDDRPTSLFTPSAPPSHTPVWPPPRTGWRLPPGTVLGAAAVALVAVAAYWLRVGTATPHVQHAVAPKSPASPVVPNPDVAPPPSDPGGEATATQDAPAPPELVRIRITTEPPGAKLEAAGLGEVCASTPCAIDALPGSELSLTARRGRAKATTRISALQGADVHLVLEVPRDVVEARRGTRLVAPDDLKVPEIFQR